MTVINCLMFPCGERVVFHKIINHCIILIPGESVFFDEYYDWKYREMKMDFAEYKKRYINRKKQKEWL